ncbi:MAG TPA: hypothetical protein VFT64_03945 [Rickettsiales bacterium]|nr:hypothetical protein [Rickettsiales bacterium]
MTQQVQEKQKEVPLTAAMLVSTVNALTAVLEEESGYMDSLQIDMVSAIQDRKLKITALLERYMRHVAKNPQIIAALTPEEKTEMLAADRNLKQAMKANYEKLLVAKNVNNAIVTCVTGIFASRRSNKVYNARGSMYTSESYSPPVSVTLNKMA